MPVSSWWVVSVGLPVFCAANTQSTMKCYLWPRMVRTAQSGRIEVANFWTMANRRGHYIFYIYCILPWFMVAISKWINVSRVIYVFRGAKGRRRWGHCNWIVVPAMEWDFGNLLCSLSLLLSKGLSNRIRFDYEKSKNNYQRFISQLSRLNRINCRTQWVKWVLSTLYTLCLSFSICFNCH